MTLITRFAPTPSGHLHLGSVMCALGTYMIAKKSNGLCYLRIDNLDSPRCKELYTKSIIDDLKTLGFKFDGNILYQKQREQIYKAYISTPKLKQYLFKCSCTREYLKNHQCQCKDRPIEGQNCSYRFNHQQLLEPFFIDELKGNVLIEDNFDFINIIRKDKVISYNFASVVDDIELGITHIIRGNDFLNITPVQNAIFKALDKPIPHYIHLPLLMIDKEHKISKQNNAPRILDILSPQQALFEALKYLGVDCSKLNINDNCAQIIKNAIKYFKLENICKENFILGYNKFCN